MEPEESAAVYLEYTGYPPIFVQSQRVGVPGNIVILILIVIFLFYIMTLLSNGKAYYLYLYLCLGPTTPIMKVHIESSFYSNKEPFQRHSGR